MYSSVRRRDLTERADEFMQTVNTLMSKLRCISGVTLQLETGFARIVGRLRALGHPSLRRNMLASGSRRTLPTLPKRGEKKGFIPSLLGRVGGFIHRPLSTAVTTI